MVIDKVTRRKHTACPVLGGYQVCLIPDKDWDNATINDIYTFTDEDFASRFEKI